MPNAGVSKTNRADRNTLHPADPRNTLFDGTLYVSNDPAAYNTVLINAQRPWSEAEFVSEDTGNNTPETEVGPDVYCVMATVKNLRANVSIQVPLVNAGRGDLAAG